MSILDRIREDMTYARKRQYMRSLGVLSCLFAEVEKVGKDKGNLATTDEQAIAVVKKFLAGVEETKNYTKDRIALENLDREIKIYEDYLPKQMTVQQITSEVALYLLANPNDKMPQIMKYFKEKFPGQYDGKTVSSAAIVAATAKNLTS